MIQDVVHHCDERVVSRADGLGPPEGDLNLLPALLHLLRMAGAGRLRGGRAVTTTLLPAVASAPSGVERDGIRLPLKKCSEI